MARRLATVPGVALIAAAAAMWGTDALFRKPLAESTSAATIVFGEHVILVLITLPLVVPAMRALFAAGTRYVLAGIAVGAGASAVAFFGSQGLYTYDMDGKLLWKQDLGPLNAGQAERAAGLFELV